MRRSGRRALTAAILIAFAAAACSELFDDPAQCKTDRDCMRFGAVCDTARGVCVSRADVADAGDVDAIAPPGDSGADSAPDERCDLPNKPRETVATVETDAGPDGGPQGEITGQVTLSCTKDWILRGPVFVRAGATLTVRPGTTIRAEPGTDASLVIQPGGKIIAAGTAEQPIVITSGASAPAAGDWRGVFVLGVAPTLGGSPYVGDPTLVFGGVNADDESGTLRFVRIEYPALGLVFGGVGRRTVVDSVEVRKTTDNCITFKGGTVDAKHLVCQFPADDMLEYGNGYAGRIQFFFGQKTPLGGAAGAHGVLADLSSAVVYNATLCGDAQPALGYGLVPRNGAVLDVNNAIFAGWNGGVDTVGTQVGPELRGSIASSNAGNPAYAEDAGELDAASPLFDDDDGFDEIAWFKAPARGNAETSPALEACFDAVSPKPWPAAPITAGARTPAASADGFFDTTAVFVGAFRDANDPWMRGWTRFGAD